jgi:hypothetical protein
MGTSMHRLQISLQPSELQFLKARAQRDGLSIAEVIRQLVRHEAEANAANTDVKSIWDIAGIAAESQPLLEHVAVSERPELYLAALATATREHRGASRRSALRGKKAKK